MDFPTVKTKKVLVECKACKIGKEVVPEKVPAPCPSCKSLMYPKRSWEIKK